MLTEQKRRCSDLICLFVLIFGKHTLIAGNSSIVANQCDVEKNRTKYHRFAILHSKHSLRGRRLEGKGKGGLEARETRGPWLSRLKLPLPSFSNACHAGCSKQFVNNEGN